MTLSNTHNVKYLSRLNHKMCRCKKVLTYILGILSGISILIHASFLINDQCISTTASKMFHCSATAACYYIVGLFICLADIFRCKSISKQIGIYQTYKGRSFVYLFISLPLISTYDGNFIDLISSNKNSNALAQEVSILVGAFLLISSITFFFLSFCRCGQFPNKGLYQLLSKCGKARADRIPTDFEMDFNEEEEEEEKSVLGAMPTVRWPRQWLFYCIVVVCLCLLDAPVSILL